MTGLVFVNPPRTVTVISRREIPRQERQPIGGRGGAEGQRLPSGRYDNLQSVAD